MPVELEFNQGSETELIQDMAKEKLQLLNFNL